MICRESVDSQWLAPLIGPTSVIAGPCSAESIDQVTNTALQLAAAGVRIFRAGAWKPRTMPGGFQGCGDRALVWIAQAKRLTGMLTATEVATPAHVAAALDSGIDIVWVGARTVADPFAMQAVADALAAHERGLEVGVLVKNPVSPDLPLWVGALERLNQAGVRRLAAVHRGFTAPVRTLYRNEPMWHLPIELAVKFPFLPVLADPSHMAGCRELVEPIARQAMQLGFAGLMIESHICPECALSDAAQQLTPADLARMLGKLRHAAEPLADNPDDSLTLMRAQLDALDSELLSILSRRMEVARKIGHYKRRHGMPVLQTERFSTVIDTRTARASELNLSPDFLRRLMFAIHDESIAQQLH